MISCDQGEPAEQMVTTTIAMTAANKLVPEVLMDTSLISSMRCRTLTGVAASSRALTSHHRNRRHRAQQLYPQQRTSPADSSPNGAVCQLQTRALQQTRVNV